MKVLVTGGTGMIGRALAGVPTSHELVLVGSRDADLTDASQTMSMLDDMKPDAILHLAAKVGGVKGNMDNMADFYEDNTLINLNVLRSARLYSLSCSKPIKVLSVLSTCIYPDQAQYPLTVGQIHDGPPHDSNFGYAYSKRMLDIHTRAVERQYDLKWVSAVPNNIYGEYDNFSLDNSHVIPALIRKIYEGKVKNNQVLLWGDGSALREFTYSRDVADILLWMMDNYHSSTPLNIGSTQEHTIAEVASCICDIMDYCYDDIVWDITKPTGQPRKPSDNSKFLRERKNFSYTPFKEGLRLTCKWFEEEYPNLRGVT